eukprot:1234536-Pyramimonas_sp.AAC.1
MDGKTHELITLGDMFSFGDDEYELSTEDKQAADSLVEQLNSGLKEATTKVFAEAAAAVERAKADHQALLERLAGKRRRRDEPA